MEQRYKLLVYTYFGVYLIRIYDTVEDTVYISSCPNILKEWDNLHHRIPYIEFEKDLDDWYEGEKFYYDSVQELYDHIVMMKILEPSIKDAHVTRTLSEYLQDASFAGVGEP